jgi:hypothetical protein
MKRFGTALLALVVLAGLPRPASSQAKSVPGFEKLKALVGEWRGQDGEGRVVDVSYSLTAGNTVVMETLKMADGSQMVSLYHPQGEKLMMTHYCLLNNQPRMQASADDKSLTFSLFDITNLPSPGAPHMGKLVLSFPDKDRLRHEWTLRASGRDRIEVFSFERSR